MTIGSEQLPTTELGSTGMHVTRLGYGSMGLRGPRTWGVRVVDDAAAEQVLHAVLDAGINFIDTAPDYGIAEQRIGQFLTQRRDEFFLASKCGCDPLQHDDHLEIRHSWNHDTLKRNLQDSLQRLQTDYIDLMQFHGGSIAEIQQAGLLDLLSDWKRQGLIRAVGVSSKLPDIQAHLAAGVFDVIQVPYSCLAAEHGETIAQAHAAGVGVIVRGGIAQGGPEAVIQREHLNSVWQAAKLAELLPAGMSPAEFILQCTLSSNACHTTIVGTANLDHLAENVAACQAGPLPENVVQEVQRRVAVIAKSG